MEASAAFSGCRGFMVEPSRCLPGRYSHRSGGQAHQKDFQGQLAVDVAFDLLATLRNGLQFCQKRGICFLSGNSANFVHQVNVDQVTFLQTFSVKKQIPVKGLENFKNFLQTVFLCRKLLGQLEKGDNASRRQTGQGF